MAKRVDHNSTMEVSGSQVVGERPRVPHQPGVSQHDASMWMNTSVGADEFTSVKKAARKGRRGLVIGLSAALVAAAAAGGYFWVTSASAPKPPVSAPAPATQPRPVLAAAPIAPVDAAAPAATPDAGAAPGAAPLQVDAVSGVGAPVKAAPTKKKVTVTKKKKKVTKKPAAPARRRK